ncbi:hypothetical protein SUGI_0039540 [Cryptomeria japonica]|nr:hypothetical protein SUGI_0039540 [Cryptomeria japonica]
MCNRIGSDDPRELFQMNNGLTRTVVDVHYYNLFEDKFKGMSVQQNINYVKNERATTLSSLVSANGPLIYVGEWTSEWVVKGASKSDYQRFGQAQLEVYGKTSFGWAYWTYWTETSEKWSFQWMIQNQFLKL